jgi:hypothetical protein
VAQTATARSGPPRADAPPGGGARIGRRQAWLAGEVVLLLGAVGLYFGIRGMTEGRPAVAYGNAERVTANHFVLDAVAGGLLATVAWLAFRGTDVSGPRPALC